MAFIDSLLQAPTYGWQDKNGSLVVPSRRQLLKEALTNVNFFKGRNKWLAATMWGKSLLMLPFLYFFLFHYFSLPLVLAFLAYAMIIMGTHGTIWFHRYCTHRSYTFKNSFWRGLTKNLVIKTLPEEVYVLSHHVHHVKSDLPGDPYNARAGFLYCMLAAINHQSINRSLDEKDYGRACRFMSHTGVNINSYRQYQKWGSVTSPAYEWITTLLNWAGWYGIFFLLGGHALACALFSAAMFWVLLVPAFNYTGHGKGEEKHVAGLDFDRSNLSINQWRPGYLAGEWHNNHHLFPGSARNGFLRWQLDVPWLYIRALYKLGGVSSYHDSKADFLKKYFRPKNEKFTARPRAEVNQA